MHYCISLTHTDLRKLDNEELHSVWPLAIYCVGEVKMKWAKLIVGMGWKRNLFYI